MMGLVVSGAETFARENSALGFAMIAVGIACGAGLVWREWGEPAPLMPLDLLRIPIFTLSITTSIVSFAAQMLAYVAIPFLLQSVLGRSVFATGLLMTPWPIAVGIAAPFAGRLADKVPAGLLGGVGLAIFAVGLFFLSRLGAHPSNFDIGWRMAVCGLGFGLFQSPNNRTIVSAAPKPRSGAAGGMLATARLLGQTTGAVTVGVAFHVAGVRISPDLMLAASVAALVAGAISLLRLRVTPPSRVAVYKPILD
jgi:DHA2 family multidrug resistance protein-like MFS transporter